MDPLVLYFSQENPWYLNQINVKIKTNNKHKNNARRR